MIIRGFTQSQSIKNSNDRLNLLNKEAKQKQKQMSTSSTNPSTIGVKRGTELLSPNNKNAIKKRQEDLDAAIAEVNKMQKIVETSDKTMKLLGDINEWLKEIGNKACENTENTNISQFLADVHAKLESDVCRLRAW